jgi:thiosulfate/3-mercaptopyruvate sulfurtransferase
MTQFDTIPSHKARSNLCEINPVSKRCYVLGILIISLMALAPVADAGASCCGAGNWDPSAFLNSEPGTSQHVHSGDSQNSAAGKSATADSAAGDSGSSAQKPLERAESFPNQKMFKPMKSVSSSDVIIDVSNGNSYAKSHIKNAIHIPTKDFLNGEGNLKTNEELAKILGDAGVFRDDSVVLYGNKESTGEAEFAYLVLSYLGQKDVKVLDGSVADWKAAGLPEETSENKKAVKEYKPIVKSELMADYEYVKSGQAQIVDARPFVEFGKGRIPGSVALDPSNIIKGDRIKNADDLNMVFSRLSKDKPIVVYSSDYSRSSLAWFALQLMGYKTSIYTWEDWKAHQSTDAHAAAAATATGANAASSKYTKLGTS